MKTLITGANGQLGKELTYLIKDSIKLSHEELDLKSINNIEKTLNNYNPDIIINCAAMTNVDSCEINMSDAYYINGLSLKYMADYSRRKNVYLINISTDYVFSGLKGNYKEDDLAYPLNYYGLSKLIGDNYVNSYENSLIIRTSGIYGLKNNFPLYVIKSLKDNKEIKAYNNYYSPINARILASAIYKLLPLKIKGLLNISGKRISRYEFALKIADKFNLNKNLIKIMDYSAIKTDAKRPYDSSLNNERAKKLLDYDFEDIDYNLDQLKSMI